MTLASNLDLNYRDEFFLAADLDPATLQKSSVKLNARIALLSESHWQAALLIQNITDEDTLSYGEDLSFGNGNFYGDVICNELQVQLNLDCTSAPGNSIPAAAADYNGSYVGILDRPRSYSLSVRYRFL